MRNIVRWAADDQASTRALYKLNLAAMRADDPLGPPLAERTARGLLKSPAVARPHGGHRLGLLVKAAMLEWLAEAEPALRCVVTWNAASNQHMIAINEALGYEFLTPLSRSYELAVADLLGPP